MRPLLAWLLLVGVARAEDPGVQFGPLQVEEATVGGERGVRVTAPILSTGLTGRVCLMRFELSQGDKRWQESRQAAVAVAQWNESSFYKRSFLSSTFDPGRPVTVSFHLVDLVAQRDLGGVTAALQAGAPTLVLDGVDLRETWSRARRGERLPARGDGAAFADRFHKLPPHRRGYWRAWLVAAGRPQRLVVGEGGELYFSPDQLKTFVPLN
jgi:hypothetical protein